MNQDEINAQNQQPNDEQRQQIRAERKLFGGIIKKGDMFQSTLNIVLLIILLPLMLIQELYYRIIDLALYLKDKFFDLIDYLKLTIISVIRWIKKTYHQIVVILKIVITKIYNALEYITSIITKYTKLIVKVVYEKIKYVLDKIINIIRLITKYVLDKLYIFADKCTIVYKKIQDFVIKWFMIIFNKIKTWILIARQFISEQARKIWNYVTIKFEQFCQYMFQKIKQLCKILYDIVIYVTDKLEQFYEYIKQKYIIPLIEQLIKLSQLLKNKFLELLLFLQDQLLIFLEWMQVQLTILKEKITIFMKWLKTKVVLFTLYCIDESLKFCYKIKNQVIKPSAGFIKRISEIIIKHVKNISIKIINSTTKGLKSVIKVIVAVKKRFFSAGSHNFKGKMKLKIKKLTDFSYEKGTIIYEFVSKILQIIKLGIIKLAQKIKQAIKYIVRQIIRACKIIRKYARKFYRLVIKYSKMIYRGVKKIIFKSISIIKKVFKFFLEIFCKIIIKFVTIFKILEIINFITDFIFEKCFQILLIPQIILEKILSFWINFIFVLLPNITLKIGYALLYVGYKIVKQTKKVSMIIKQKIIDPIVYGFMFMFQVCKHCYGIVKQKIINFWGWMKYDYILPAWASIRLFAVEVKKTTLRVILYCKQKYQQAKIIVIEVFVQIKQFFIKIWAFVVAQFVSIKNYLLAQIKIAAEFAKMVFQILKQKINEITLILIQPIIQLKNRIIQSILTLKQVGEEIMNQLKERMIQSRNARRKQIEKMMIYINNVKAGIKESIIQTKNDVALRMNLISQNIQQQVQQQKQNLISLKNDTIAAIKSIFRRN